MRASRRCVALGIAVGSLALWPAGAGAAPIDVASDHAALVAYHSYVAGLLSNVPAIKTAIDKYVSSVAARCPGVLAPLALLPPGSANQGALLAVVEELGEDLGIASDGPLRGPLSNLAAALTRLRWSSPETDRTIRGYLTAQHRLLALGPSRLCTDLRAFASSVGQQTPRGTLRWLAKAGRVVSDRENRFTAFEAVLAGFARPADAGLIHDIDRTSGRFQTAVKSSLTPAARRLLAALGLPG